jgi:hypothetical protein
MGGTGGLRKDRINMIRKWLKVQNQHLPDGHVDRQPKLFVDRHQCPNLLREMDAYRYAENKSESRNDPEEPMKKDDHTPEALGRFFAGKYGTLLRQGGPKVRKATTNRTPARR